jgi:hypothetical protein
MQIVTWSEWLDQHIPYYEQQRQLDQYRNEPPQSILIIDPTDRNKRVSQYGFVGSTWDAMANEIKSLNFQTEPVFLETDTHQRWYWAFWNQKEALIAILKLS